ncbi:MAG: N-acetylmuramoyl-L-alanine amidase [Desulfovibrionaceae bacterium]|nr:N-acetylmuramoyl-L-alanine amidase [Desulfovibrionaceae bacterium]
MRFISSFLLLTFLLGLASWPAQAAQTAKPQTLQRLIAEFDALEANSARGARRDLWLSLEEGFAAQAAKNKGDAGAKAAFYHARAREELGRRSFLPTDHREAVSRFASVTAAYPKYAVAAESLYRQADILTHRLGDRKSAIAALEKLIKNYPKAGKIPEARQLLARIKEEVPPQAKKEAPEPQSKAKAPARSGAQTDSAEPARAAGRTGGKAETVMEQLGLTVKTIMIDAGHGGHDPGAQAAGITEKSFTLAMAKRVGALLQKEGFTVLYTRTSDKYMPLQERPDTANAKKADLFISIHVNANPKSGIRGLETYYLDEAKTQDAITVAARENGVSVRNISDLQFILTDLMLSSKVKESHHLADCVHGGILKRLKSAKFAAHDNGVRSAPFYVLVGARMPAILVEFGYITNEHDVDNLKNEAYLQRQAEGLVQGIVQYKTELAKLR